MSTTQIIGAGIVLIICFAIYFDVETLAIINWLRRILGKKAAVKAQPQIATPSPVTHQDLTAAYKRGNFCRLKIGLQTALENPLFYRSLYCSAVAKKRSEIAAQQPAPTEAT